VFASELGPAIAQFTALDYRNPSGIPAGRVLVVGSGNTGGGIAADLVASHEVVWSMGGTPRFPRRLTGEGLNELLGRLGAPPVIEEPNALRHEADLMWWFDRIGWYRVERNTPLGQRMSARATDPSIVGPGPDPLSTGAAAVGRVVGVERGKPVTADGQRLDVSSVVWATGLRPGLPPVEPSILDSDGRPAQVQGETTVPGVYVLGLRWMHRLGSGLFYGVAEDAEHVAALIERRLSPGALPA
jgi:putative flavoprotein involved in K+ transport